MHEKKNDNAKKIMSVHILKFAKSTVQTKITNPKNRLFISIQAASGLTRNPPKKA